MPVTMSGFPMADVIIVSLQRSPSWTIWAIKKTPITTRSTMSVQVLFVRKDFVTFGTAMVRFKDVALGMLLLSVLCHCIPIPNMDIIPPKTANKNTLVKKSVFKYWILVCYS